MLYIYRILTMCVVYMRYPRIHTYTKHIWCIYTAYLHRIRIHNTAYTDIQHILLKMLAEVHSVKGCLTHPRTPCVHILRYPRINTYTKHICCICTADLRRLCIHNTAYTDIQHILLNMRVEVHSVKACLSHPRTPCVHILRSSCFAPR